MLLQEKERRLRTNKLDRYAPYLPQIAFHKAGIQWNERLFMAGNQLGKTLSGGAEVAMHLTGLYPEWWEGLRFERPTRIWAAGETSEATRDGVQRILLGSEEDGWGTGTIPKHLIIGQPVRSQRVPGGVAYILVRHVSGGTSKLQFKTYEQGRAKWQSATLDFVWFDEEPPADIYSEGLTRTNHGQKGQRTMTTFTPLKGMTDTVNRFLSNDPAIRGKYTHVTRMGIADVGHYSEEQKQQIINSYPTHEREARSNGTPIMGSGRVFTTPEDKIKIKGLEIQSHWAEIGAVDFGGFDHPAAAVKGYHDRDNDVVYITRVWRSRDVKLSQHASALRAMISPGTPVSWPHDGLQHDRMSGQTYADEFRNEGLNMLPDHAHIITTVNGKESKSNSLEATVLLMDQRLEQGKLRVDSSCVEFFEEYGIYHRKDGVIVKVADDVISAVRYLIMSLRFAEVPQNNSFNFSGSINEGNDTSWVT